MTEPATASASAPPAAPVDVTLPKTSWFWRRSFCMVAAGVVLALWYVALVQHQTAWPCAAVLGLIIFVYVSGATATEVVQLFQASGIIRAAQSASTALSSVAETVTDVAHQILPVPTTGGRTDLAS